MGNALANLGIGCRCRGDARARRLPPTRNNQRGGDMNRTAKLAIGVLGVLVLLVGGTVAYAAVPSASGVLTACVQKSTGAVRLIDVEKNPPATCSNTEFK